MKFRINTYTSIADVADDILRDEHLKQLALQRTRLDKGNFHFCPHCHTPMGLQAVQCWHCDLRDKRTQKSS